MGEIDRELGEGLFEVEGPAVVAVTHYEDLLAACKGDCGGESHGIGFCAGVGEANELDAGG